MKKVVKIEEFETSDSIIVKEGRSINKISKELSDTVSKMKELAPTFNSSKGDEREKIKKTLLELTAKKKELLKELDDAVLGKDKNIELELSEAIRYKDPKVKGKKVAVDTIEIDGVTVKWGPDDGTSDAHASYAEFTNGKELSPDELDDLTDNNPDLIHRLSLEQYFESKVNKVDEARRIQTKRKYTENYPSKTVGYHAKVRNKVLEAIKDGKITQEEFDNIIKEFSKDGKRWLKRNGKMFNISEEGISLSRFGKRILKGITVNEKFDRKKDGDYSDYGLSDEFSDALDNLPEKDFTPRNIVKLAKKMKQDPVEALQYAKDAFGWMKNMKESKVNEMKSNIAKKWGDYKTLTNDLKEFLENILDANGPEGVELTLENLEEVMNFGRELMKDYAYEGKLNELSKLTFRDAGIKNLADLRLALDVARDNKIWWDQKDNQQALYFKNAKELKRFKKAYGLDEGKLNEVNTEYTGKEGLDKFETYIERNIGWEFGISDKGFLKKLMNMVIKQSRKEIEKKMPDWWNGTGEYAKDKTFEPVKGRWLTENKENKNVVVSKFKDYDISEGVRGYEVGDDLKDFDGMDFMAAQEVLWNDDDFTDAADADDWKPMMKIISKSKYKQKLRKHLIHSKKDMENFAKWLSSGMHWPSESKKN